MVAFTPTPETPNPRSTVLPTVRWVGVRRWGDHSMIRTAQYGQPDMSLRSVTAAQVAPGSEFAVPVHHPTR